jgi:hypothetical protein
MPLGFLLETLSDPLEIGLFKSSTRRKCQIPLRLPSRRTGRTVLGSPLFEIF